MRYAQLLLAALMVVIGACGGGGGGGGNNTPNDPCTAINDEGCSDGICTTKQVCDGEQCLAVDVNHSSCARFHVEIVVEFPDPNPPTNGAGKRITTRDETRRVCAIDDNPADPADVDWADPSCADTPTHDVSSETCVAPGDCTADPKPIP